MSKESVVKEQALKFFDDVGLAKAQKPGTIDHYETWLANGFHGEMSYLKKHLRKKSDPSLLLERANSWISLALSYDTPEPLSIEQQETFIRDKKGWIARYARGQDYHLKIKSKQDELIQILESKFPGESFLGSVDVNAVLERDAAAAAGLGWIGKNTCLISKTHGSFIFLSEILTTLDLTPDKPVMDHCGKCNRCIEACPTQALVEPKILDATKCISYWTIESKKIAPPELAAQFGAQVFGCDICQDVCPWNQKSHSRLTTKGSAAFIEDGSFSLQDVLNSSNEEIKLMLREKALNRITPERFRENVEVAFINVSLGEG